MKVDLTESVIGQNQYGETRLSWTFAVLRPGKVTASGDDCMTGNPITCIMRMTVTAEQSIVLSNASSTSCSAIFTVDIFRGHQALWDNKYRSTVPCRPVSSSCPWHLILKSMPCPTATDALHPCRCRAHYWVPLSHQRIWMASNGLQPKSNLVVLSGLESLRWDILWCSGSFTKDCWALEVLHIHMCIFTYIKYETWDHPILLAITRP